MSLNAHEQLLVGSNQHSVFTKEYFLAATVVLALEVENQQKHQHRIKFNWASLEICEMLGQQILG